MHRLVQRKQSALRFKMTEKEKVEFEKDFGTTAMIRKSNDFIKEVDSNNNHCVTSKEYSDYKAAKVAEREIAWRKMMKALRNAPMAY